jgi:hypothetical protein
VRNAAGLALSIVLTLTLVLLVAIFWKQRTQRVSESTPVIEVEPSETAQSTEFEQADSLEISPEDAPDSPPRAPMYGNAPSGVLTLNSWSALQEYADRLFNRWDFGEPQPEDLGHGYFDGVIGR